MDKRRSEDWYIGTGYGLIEKEKKISFPISGVIRPHPTNPISQRKQEYGSNNYFSLF